MTHFEAKHIKNTNDGTEKAANVTFDDLKHSFVNK